MALTAAELDERIAQLKAARDSGVLSIRHGDTSTTFRSLDELQSTLRRLEAEKQASEGRRSRRVGYVYQGGKGL